MPTQTPTVSAPPGSTPSRVELILHEIDSLPTLPAVAARLIALTTSDDSSAREVVELVAQDPVLTAGLLRLARRADQGVRNTPLTVHQVVTLLGFNALRNVVLSLQVHAALPTPAENEQAATLRRELWRHAVAVACAAEMLAPTVLGTRDDGQAFVVGLLHDIGKIALDAVFPKSYARVAERVEQRRQDVCAAEREVFGVDHTIAGKRLATHWKLPPAVIECIWLHHQDPAHLASSVRHPSLVALVHLADRLVRRLRIGFSGYRGDSELESSAASIGVTPEKLREISQALPERIAPLGELLDLDDPVSRHLYVESLEKANRELGAMNVELADARRHLAKRNLFFNAVNAFIARLTATNDVAEVCAQAAQALSGIIRPSEAIVMVVDGQAANAFVGHSDGDRVGARAISADDSLRAALGRLVSGGGRDEPGVFAGALWERCGPRKAPYPVMSRALVGSDALEGAILLSTESRTVQGCDEEWAAYGAAVRLALEQACARRDGERHQEELYDITRRLQATQRDLVRARTISMIAEMAAGAAHEINNPLSVISGRAQLLLNDRPSDEQRRALGIIVEKTNEATQIVTELMNFAKPAPPQPISQPLSPLLESWCQYWRRRFSLSERQLKLQVADADAVVYADTQHLREILDAAMENAVHACPPETPRIEINSPSAASDETVRIDVTDNGAGMSPDVVERAIDPFFSHRSAGRGRGLGLSRAYRLAGINGGQLWIESTPEHGTTVTVELPSRPSTSPAGNPPQS